MLEHLRILANGIAATVLAPECASCRATLDAALSGCVCLTCWAGVRRISPPLCGSCGASLPRPAPQCRDCEASPSVVSCARAVGEYEGTLREIVHALKYDGRRSIARALALRMRVCGREVLDGAHGVVPVPLHWRRHHARGFNQARELARHLGVPLIEPLARRRPTRPQVELAASLRRGNVEGAFVVRRGFRRRRILDGLTLVIVDDVRTTGATLEACAKALIDAGSVEVRALTAARVSAAAAGGPPPLRGA